VLAAGVMTTIAPDAQANETVSLHNVMELAAIDSNFEFAKDVRFRRDIWALEFSFKPVRMIWVDIPQADGHMRRQLVWYMVYSVTNPGQALRPVQQPDKTFALERVDIPVQFVPKFVLKSHEFSREYPDRVIPLALPAIRMREDRNRNFLNSITMAKEEIPVGETRWGIAMWENIDPRIDFFSIYVRGLTNAYRWQDQPAGYTPGQDPIAKGRKFARKELKLNFWRPGDEYYENEKEIRYGTPTGPKYQWVFR